ncbi:glutaredoxin family protein [Pseudomonas typographi]|uniref:Glutaredoxin family protein n=1 Tax=Pseudomonas typographi TaxID=2715964 RepID=A0ABR7Z4E9_9PSED|nr:glutaredoxin family protein [Pseudomonas typographi]MBD1553241.1 glutaredoxin family protein [Pseudomonas typographi]MBD1588121.1 glutaredoxin family protein [Pseudomonas typographi]MBD1600345.1 glutaredoxin family protein [Pseudomonas typographi]
MLAECKLYIVTGHPLCSLAEDMLMDWVERAGLLVELVDITEQPLPLAQWSSRVPVLERVDTGAQLPWPFDLEDIEHFLK